MLLMFLAKEQLYCTIIFACYSTANIQLFLIMGKVK